MYKAGIMVIARMDSFACVYNSAAVYKWMEIAWALSDSPGCLKSMLLKP